MSGLTKWSRWVFLLVLVASPRVAHADEPAPAQGTLMKPVLLGEVAPVYPPEAYQAGLEADVVVAVTVDVEGQVAEVELEQRAGHGFDEAALVAARKLRFSPARLDGVATPVRVLYTFHFRRPQGEGMAKPPAVPAATPQDARPAARLELTVQERGTRTPISSAEVYVLDRDEVFLTDAEGRLLLDLPPGAWAMTVRAPGFDGIEITERLEPGERVEVGYRLERHRHGRYRTVVLDANARTEIGRSVLTGDEMRLGAGTMGDPLRAVSLLPGAAGATLGSPVVRGALPGDSTFEVDGIGVPLLYHFLVGRSIVHPYFIDQIAFEPGGTSVEHGRFVGGRVAASTARTDKQPVYSAGASLIDLDVFAATPVGRETHVAVAARLGTLGLLMKAFEPSMGVSYYDYQARVRHPVGGGQLTLRTLGAADALSEVDGATGRLEGKMELAFHRADLRYERALGAGSFTAGLEAGLDVFHTGEYPDLGQPEPPDLIGYSSYLVRPYASGRVSLTPWLDWRMGADLEQRWFRHRESGMNDDFSSPYYVQPRRGLVGGAWTMAQLDLGRLTLAPGVRADAYLWQLPDRRIHHYSIDPRLSASFRVSPRLELKGSAGLHHGAPRPSTHVGFVVMGPLPATEGLAAAQGLSRSWQFQLGAEAKLPWDLEGMLTGFYHTQRLAFDFELQYLDRPEDEPEVSPLDIPGRSFGAEIMVRRRLGHDLSGWLTYAISRAEKKAPVLGRFPAAFDQTHAMNLALSWALGRSWTLGSTLHIHTGRPMTPQEPIDPSAEYVQYRDGAHNAARLPTYWQLDLRIDKREVFDTWYLDFYIDVLNASAQPQVVGYQYAEGSKREPEEALFILPMVGVRGVY